jgi:hypothetical protein
MKAIKGKGQRKINKKLINLSKNLKERFSGIEIFFFKNYQMNIKILKVFY